MLVFGTNLVLSAEEDALPANTPLIGWQNLVTFSNVSSDTADADYPITNIANPATNIEWRAADTTAQEIFLALNTVEDVDYVGIARHNFGSPDAAIAVELPPGAYTATAFGSNNTTGVVLIEVYELP